MKKAAVIMGSDSDLPVMSKAFKVLEDYGIPFDGCHGGRCNKGYRCQGKI